MKHGKDVTGGRRVLYLAAVLLPVLGLFPFLRRPELIPQGPTGGIVWLFLVPPALGFLLGLTNLVLIWLRHPPRENRPLWDGMLLVSLVPDLGLLGLDAFLALIQHGIWAAPT